LGSGKGKGENCDQFYGIPEGKIWNIVMVNDGEFWEVGCDVCGVKVGKVENSKIMFYAQMTTRKEIKY
jgi:hypothetical protein